MTKEIGNFQKENGEAGLRLVSDKAGLLTQTPVRKQFVNFIFLRAGSQWRRLDNETKALYKTEFETVFESFPKDCLLYSYSLVGFDSKADLMLWRICDSLDLIQELTARLYQTKLGSFLETTDNYLSVTKRTMFVGEPSDDRFRVEAGTAKYHFVYPCAKDDDWYKMPIAERDALIEENFMVGMKFPNIKIHLTHAFGFNDHEYLISFEADEPRDFLALVDELRQASATKFTLRGTPIYTCRQRALSECLDALG